MEESEALQKAGIAAHQTMLDAMTQLKDEGNRHFSAADYAAAAQSYSKGLDMAITGPDPRRVLIGSNIPMVPVVKVIIEHADVVAILRNNRATCYLKMGLYMEAAQDAHVTAESVIGVWGPKGFDSAPAYEHQFRRFGKADDMHLKGRLRASRAFASMGNSARALEELEWLEWHRAFVELGPGRPVAQLRTNPFNLPGDVATDLRDLRSMMHPNTKAVQHTKLDWRGCVAGTWRSVTTKGTSPLPLHSASVAYFNNKVFLFGGSDPNRFQHNGDMYVLELATYTWRKGGMKGLPSIKESAVRYEESASVVWQGSAYFWSGGTCVLQFDLAHEAWQVRQSSWPKQVLDGASFAAKGGEGKLLDFAAVAARGKMYVYGGAIRGSHTSLGDLVALDLATLKWEVLHSGARGITSAETPEARYCCSMWEAHGKLWVFGGRIDRWTHGTTPIEDYTITQDRYLYSWDLNLSAWADTGRMSPDHVTGNPPCGRSEVALALATKADGNALAAVYGGYTTGLRHHPTPSFHYLGDTFIFDVARRRWSMVHCDQWPPHRAGASMVFIPDSKGAGSSNGKGSSKAGGGTGKSGSKGGASSRDSSSGGGAAAPDCSNGADAGASKRSKRLVPGKFLMLGGYLGGGDFSRSAFGATDPDPANVVWELKLDAHPKHAKAVCHGCGKFDVGMKQCTGSCGGAVIVCGPECHKKAWDAGHRLWCKKKPATKAET